MKFWLKNFLILVTYGIIVVLFTTAISYFLNHFFSFNFIFNSLLTCVLVIFIFMLAIYFLIFSNNQSTTVIPIQLVRKHLEAVDLIQNILFFLLFPFLGILINVDSSDHKIMVNFRYIVGSTLIILKISMLIIKYMNKSYISSRKQSTKLK